MCSAQLDQQVLHPRIRSLFLTAPFFERRTGNKQQARYCEMIGACLWTMVPTFARPHQRRGGKHTIERIHGGTVGKEHPYRICSAKHCGPMQGRHAITVETAVKHDLEDA
ncbi:MAG TPA: hypothetical protein VMQ17_24300 [Candidatus Sulfotelmatobacter sp.]|nr:hypothetical protein [Candidatus Sulfotelmatobacter sp.]